jgi:hypothetical protein
MRVVHGILVVCLGVVATATSSVALRRGRVVLERACEHVLRGGDCDTFNKAVDVTAVELTDLCGRCSSVMSDFRSAGFDFKGDTGKRICAKIITQYEATHRRQLLEHQDPALEVISEACYHVLGGSACETFAVTTGLQMRVDHDEHLSPHQMCKHVSSAMSGQPADNLGPQLCINMAQQYAKHVDEHFHYHHAAEL